MTDKQIGFTKSTKAAISTVGTSCDDSNFSTICNVDELAKAIAEANVNGDPVHVIIDDMPVEITLSGEQIQVNLDTGDDCEKPLYSVLCNTEELAEAIAKATSNVTSTVELTVGKSCEKPIYSTMCNVKELAGAIAEASVNITNNVVIESSCAKPVYTTLCNVDELADALTKDCADFNTMMVADAEGNCFLAKICKPEGRIFNMATGDQIKPSDVRCCNCPPAAPVAKCACVLHAGWDQLLTEGDLENATQEFSITAPDGTQTSAMFNYLETSDGKYKSSWYTAVNDFIAQSIQGLTYTLMEDVYTDNNSAAPTWRVEYCGTEDVKFEIKKGINSAIGFTYIASTNTLTAIPSWKGTNPISVCEG